MTDKLAKNETFQLLAATPEKIDEMKELIAEVPESDGMTPFDLPELKVPSGGGTSWEVTTAAGEESVKVLRGIILVANKVRQYYAGEFTGEGVPPHCSSQDGVTGHGSPGGQCAECPLAQWGSAKNGAQACAERRHMLMLTPDSILPSFLNLPPTSLKAFRKYRTLLLGQSLPISGVITEMTLTKAKNATGIEYSQVNFSSGGVLSPEERARAKEFADGFAALMQATAQMPVDAPPVDTIDVDEFIADK